MTPDDLPLGAIYDGLAEEFRAPAPPPAPEPLPLPLGRIYDAATEPEADA